MEYGAIDLHLQRSQIRIVAEDGTVSARSTDRDEPDRVRRPVWRAGPDAGAARNGHRKRMGRADLEACGHEVIVADPNYTLMYGTRARAVKTDKRDVATLAEACRLGIYRPAHRVSAAQRQQRRELRVREQLVRVRTQAINLLRAQLRQEGYRLASGSAETVVARYDRLAVPAALQRGAHAAARLTPPPGADPHAGGRDAAGPGGGGSDCAAVDDGAGDRPDHGVDVSRHGRRRSTASRMPAVPVPSSAWCRARTARGNGSAGGGSPRRARRWPGAY